MRRGRTGAETCCRQVRGKSPTEGCSDDEENTAAADTNITCGQSDCFSRSLHEYRDGTGKENHSCEQADRKQCEYNRRAADDGADLFRVLFPEITGDPDSDAHCKLCHNKGDKVQHLAAGGNRRQSGGGAESADDEQIDGAVAAWSTSAPRIGIIKVPVSLKYFPV